MRTYTSTKTLKAKPMTLGEYNKLRGWSMPAEENMASEGYLVEYEDGGRPNHSEFDGYISWSPKDVFERTYREAAPTTYAPHVQRLVDEHNELIDRIGKLEAFIRNSPVFTALPGTQQALMREQLGAMAIYATCLTERLAYLESAS